MLSSVTLGRPNASAPAPDPASVSCSVGENLGTLHVETSVSVDSVLL